MVCSSLCLLLARPIHAHSNDKYEASSAQRLHTFTGTGEMRINPERGFRHEIHGACTGDGHNGISDKDIQQLAQFNLTIAQVYCYLPTTARLTAQDLNAIATALVSAHMGLAAAHPPASAPITTKSDQYCIETTNY